MFGRKKKKDKVVEFHYKDRVKVIDGFYKGRVGILVDEATKYIPQYGRINEYQIRLNNKVFIWVYENGIKKIAKK